MTDKKDASPRSFAVFLANLGEGDANRELSEMLHKLGEALIRESLDRGSPVKGQITLKVNMAIDPRGVVAVGWDASVREPKPLRHSSTMWVDRNGNLVHENPRQQRLPLHEVNARERVVELDEQTGEVRTAREV